jgi:uncharacterized protein (TIGR03067 family)
MRHTVFLAVIAILFVAADEKKSDDKKDLELLKGKWTLVSLQANGQTKEDASGGEFTFDGDKLHIKLNDQEHSGRFKLDASKKPKQIDVTPADGPEKDKLLEGIYSLSKNELKICIAHHAGPARPKEFTSTEGSDVMLLTLKRGE